MIILFTSIPITNVYYFYKKNLNWLVFDCVGCCYEESFIQVAILCGTRLSKPYYGNVENDE